MPNLVVRTRADSPELRKAATAIEQAAWTELGYLNFTRAHYDLYGQLLESYADYQLCLVDEATGYPVAVANCVPLCCDGADGLPPEGWDWVVERAAARRPGEPADMLGALAISVPAIYRAKGYARVMIRELLALAERRGLKGLVAPVRPSLKARHPRVAIEDYITWTDAAGRPYDPWLRSHLAAGGRIIGPCERSMVVEEPVGFWETWTNRRFERVLRGRGRAGAGRDRSRPPARALRGAQRLGRLHGGPRLRQPAGAQCAIGCPHRPDRRGSVAQLDRASAFEAEGRRFYTFGSN